jgi:hypothetical protein
VHIGATRGFADSVQAEPAEVLLQFVNGLEIRLTSTEPLWESR